MTQAVATAGRPSNTLHFVVGEMNGKLDQLMASLIPQFTALREEDAALGVRITTLEAFRWQVYGGFALLVFVVSAWEIIRVLVPLH